MRPHDGITITRAARQLGVGSRTLFRELRARGVLSKNNLATRPYIASGEFLNEHRSIFKRGTRIQHWYTVALVTGRGMALLQEIVDGLGTEREMVVGQQPGLPGKRRHRERAADLRRLGAPGRAAEALDDAGEPARSDRRQAALRGACK